MAIESELGEPPSELYINDMAARGPRNHPLRTDRSVSPGWHAEPMAATGQDDDSDIAPRGAEVVEQHWPYDGPYGHYRTGAAAAALERLVRYLNNATGKASALPYPSTAGDVITDVRAAAHGLDQLLTQLADFYERQAWDNPNLYDDRSDPDHPASDTAHNLAGALESARAIAGQLAAQLEHAAGYASHLGHRLSIQDGTT